jgi:hypothetical protein
MKSLNAFPINTHEPFNEGMTLRDYFAAKAMQTILNDWNENPSYSSIAEISYKMADAMLMEKNNE